VSKQANSHSCCWCSRWSARSVSWKCVSRRRSHGCRATQLVRSRRSG
jgi:hypothetical protein